MARPPNEDDPRIEDAEHPPEPLPDEIWDGPEGPSGGAAEPVERGAIGPL